MPRQSRSQPASHRERSCGCSALSANPTLGLQNFLLRPNIAKVSTFMQTAVSKAPTVCLLFDQPVKLNINGNKLFINCLQMVNKRFHLASDTRSVLVLQKSAFDPNLHQHGLGYCLHFQRRTQIITKVT